MNLLAACKTGGADVAIGSRYVTGVNVVNWPMGRVMMSYFASKYVRFITGMKIHDTTAGFVCYRRRVLETIGLDSIRFKGYAFQIEMKFTAYKCGFVHQGGAYHIHQPGTGREQNEQQHLRRGRVRCHQTENRQLVPQIPQAVTRPGIEEPP